METKFENYVAPLSKNEFESLKCSIQQEGCRDALVTWHGIILDGHNRYRICTELGIPYKTVEMEFEDEEHARLWMVQNQLARRNIKPFQKCEMVYPLEKIISEEVLARKREANSKARRGEDSEVSENLHKPQNTAKAIAEFIEISDRTWFKAKYVIENGDEELKSLVRSGKKSIHAAYKKLKNEKEDVRPKSEKIDGYTPVTHVEKARTLHYEKPNRERTPQPFPIVRDGVRATVEGMLIELDACLNSVRYEDIGKLEELAEILRQGYIRAKKRITEESNNGKMVRDESNDGGTAGN